MSRDGASERGPRQHTPSSPPLPYADVIATGRRVSMLSAPQTGALRVRGRGRIIADARRRCRASSRFS
jgi:hypothetical protein